MREFARVFYNSKAWRICRLSYIQMAHGLCERCGQPGKIVHHKVYLSPKNINDPNVALNYKNLEYLCQDCHNAEHMARLPVASGLSFDVNGDVVPIIKDNVPIY